MKEVTWHSIVLKILFIFFFFLEFFLPFKMSKSLQIIRFFPVPYSRCFTQNNSHMNSLCISYYIIIVYTNGEMNSHHQFLSSCVLLSITKVEAICFAIYYLDLYCIWTTLDFSYFSAKLLFGWWIRHFQSIFVLFYYMRTLPVMLFFSSVLFFSV